MPFEKGKSGNPQGRPKLPDDVREAKQLNRVEFERILNRFMSMTREEIFSVGRDPQSSAMEMMIASIITKGVQYGDPARLNFIIERLLGKLPDKLDPELLPYFDAIKRLKDLPQEKLIELFHQSISPTEKGES